MPDKTWKAFEREVSKLFGTTRNALSGINSKLTHSDSHHDTLFIECKYRQKLSLFSLFRKTKELAEKEKKLPIICQKEKNAKGFLITVHSSNIDEFINCYAETKESLQRSPISD